MDRLIGEHRGRIANTAGDSVLAEFPSVVEAVKCAVEVQKAIAEADEGVPDDRRMSFRIGVHVGDVMVRGADILGDGVNVAARLQALADPGGICLSGERTSMHGRCSPLPTRTWASNRPEYRGADQSICREASPAGRKRNRPTRTGFGNVIASRQALYSRVAV